MSNMKELFNIKFNSLFQNFAKILSDPEQSWNVLIDIELERFESFGNKR